jgi:LEA14-like dessication related protein
MKYLYLICLSIGGLFSFISNAQDVASYSEKGIIEFKDTLYNVGAITELGGMVSRQFEFANLGPEWFVLESAETTCGCLVVSFSEDSIAPGGHGKIEVSFDPFNKTGLFIGTVKIYGNTLQVPQTLYVKGFVKGGEAIPVTEWANTKGFQFGNVWLQRNYIDFGTFTTKDIITKELPIYNQSSYAIQLASQQSLPPYVRVALSPVKLEGKTYSVLKVSVHAKLINKLGYWAESITVGWAQEDLAPLTIVIAGNCKEYFVPMSAEAQASAPKIQPEMMMIDWGGVLQYQQLTRVMKITNTGATDLVIRQINTSCACIEVDYTKSVIKSGGYIEVTIIYDTSSRLGEETKYIQVFSNDPISPMIQIEMKVKIVETLPATTGQ